MMRHPWSHHTQDDGSIEVRYHDDVRFILTRENGNGFWQLRRAGEDQVIHTDQYRNDIFSGIQSGRLT